MKFYEQFIKLCETNNVKPTPLLSELGISKNSWQNWRDGSAVKSDTLELLANHFNVSVDYLLGRTTEPAQQIMNNNSTVTGGVQTQNYNSSMELSGLQKEMIEAMEQLPKSKQLEALQEVYKILEENKVRR